MKPSTARIRRGLDDLAGAIYRERLPLRDLRILPLGTALSPEEAPIPSSGEPGWRPIARGDRWGGYDENAWFHGEVETPVTWRVASDESTALALRFLLGVSPDFGWPEGLLYADGKLLQGINQHHEDILLPDALRSAKVIAFDVRAWSGMTRRTHTFGYAELALLDRDAEAFYYLLRAGCDLVDALDANDPLLHPLAQALESAYDALDLRLPVNAKSPLAELRARLAELRAAYTPRERLTITAIGHGHLDVAWLWQTRHTREKAARTFSIATALMEHYPEYHFLHTTPQVFAWLERDYPAIFARTTARVAEGRFETGGAMWVEADTNVVSGESLVRQILYGQRYLRETFGAEYDTLWLPDTFGYTYALPQIMLRAGLRALMTTKMSWNDTNRMPHDTFRWRGLDGSETLAHFVTTPTLPINPSFDSDTYNARLDVPSARLLWERYRDKAFNHDLLLIYGHGDGGAGPTRQSLESYRAMRELPGPVEVRLGRADEYFRALRERVWSRPDLPTWDGELYLEFHRGVYTTQAWLKRLHRRIEEQLSLAETLDATRWAFAPDDSPDSRATLDDAWRTLLMHEFHDILPGSSIGPVYADARSTLEALAQQLEGFITQAQRDLATRTGADGAWLLHNPSPSATPGATTLARLPLPRDEAPPEVMAGERALRAQVVATHDGGQELLVECPPIAGRGWLALRPRTPRPRRQSRTSPPDNHAAHAALTDTGGVTLENALYRLTLNANGEITSLIDERVGGRELLAAGALGNQLIVFDDRPRRFGSWDFDAWDLDTTYERKPIPLGPTQIRIAEDGPLRATAHIRRVFRDSLIEQDITLCRDQPRIDFTTRIDWRERHVLLKVAFPLELRVTQARSEIQFGSILRPTHRNTSWDTARFETVAHRWVDLSEGDYGVALLNDACYGHDIQGSAIRLSLLRSPTEPDADADQGAHEVTYSLLPHQGAWPRGDVVAHGYALNRPPRALPPRTDAARSDALSMPPRLFWLEDGAVILEAVKRAGDGDDLIARLYESTGSRVHANIHCTLPIEAVVEADLLERPLTAEASPAYADWLASRAASHDTPTPRADGWMCEFRPFEIRTFRVTLTRENR